MTRAKKDEERNRKKLPFTGSDFAMPNQAEDELCSCAVFTISSKSRKWARPIKILNCKWNKKS